MKKRTIYRLFIIPLLVILLVQAVVSLGTVIFGGTTSLLDQYLVSIQDRTVENRQILLENNMIQQWSNVSEEVETIENGLGEILNNRDVSISEFLNSSEMKEELLHKMLSSCLYMLRKNSVTGTFIILANGRDGLSAQECQGVYFHDADPMTNPGDYSDVLMKRGSSRFSHELNVPLDSYWTTDFAFGAAGEKEADSFYYEPLMEAEENPQLGYKNLCYWSRPFYLEGDWKNGGSEVITYSVPLIHKDGTVYGIMGIDISTKYLQDLMPYSELNQYSSYLLAERTEDGSYIPLVSTGTIVSLGDEKPESISLEETKYDGLYAIESDDEKLYASVREMHLYNTNAPFSERVWVLAGVMEESGLFGIGSAVLRNLSMAILLSLVFGFVGTVLIVGFVTKPIRSLAECIRGSSEHQLKSFKESNIVEVDELYEVVSDLTEKQREAEFRLMEEKERYLIALKSSTDLLFSYDIRQDTIDVSNFAMDEKSGQAEFHLENLKERLNSGWIYREDLEKFLQILENPEESVFLVFRGRFFEQDVDYEWMELNGKVISDSNGEKTKIIGSLKNIHEQKVRELMRLESARRDRVTGLYERSVGEDIIRLEFEKGKTGCLVLLDFDHFRELNERYGMVFGNAVLEETGRQILLMKKEVQKRNELEQKRITALRMGGDEILIWFSEIRPETAQVFLKELISRIDEIYDGRRFPLSFSAGISRRKDGEEFKDCLYEAGRALAAVKAGVRKGMAVFEELSADEIKAERREINEIAALPYSDARNMVSHVFTFFDKGGDISNILPVLFVKLGRFYGASDIVLTLVDMDFCTSYVKYQWHDVQGDRQGTGVRRFSRQEFEVLTGFFSDGSREFGGENALSRDECRFFGLVSGKNGICVPMYDSGNYIGAIAYVCRENQPLWAEKDRSDLQEITKIIETNINRERYDMASRAKSDFLSRMSHEIRTPMNAIIGMTDIARHEVKKPERLEECLDKIDRSSQFLLSLINDILDMSKIESGKMKLDIRTFDMEELAESVAGLIEPQAEAKRIQFVRRVSLTHKWLMGDPLHLSQVLVNLLGNAVKFTPEGGTVTLTVEQEEVRGNSTGIRFSVKDTGIGIERENFKRIFNAFEQAGDDTTKEYGGTGLGLAISSSLIRMMGGNISLNSRPGEGSNFYFKICLKTGQEETKNPEKENTDNVSCEGKRLLLVEDNELNMEIAKVLLEMNGFLVETAENGKIAVERFAGHDEDYYDAILMDIRMPVMDGLEAARVIRRMDRPDAGTVPIIAMTANAFDEDMKKSIESGMNGHLAKPIDIEELIRTLKKVMK
ncbi:ATP-binding protein [Qiania dongpingensis]|uniref:Circadian input-output histidine kinase CikA n=1 Tax=Qiania dongpingensis TaxID=2763669 RepID=A0A7G9G152_9FIRM|nr:ATP-binding protein [Qiania dongpingensis]QNM04534.1 response regulator [Qiania dongpingensis]